MLLCEQRVHVSSLSNWEDINKTQWRSSNTKTPSQPFFWCTQSRSLAFMRQHGRLMTIYIWRSRWNYSRWYSVGVISHGKVTAMKGVKLAPGTNISHTNHAVASPSHPCFATVLPSTELLLKPAVIECYPVFLQHIGEARITRTIQTHWLYLIKGEWPVLSNSSSSSGDKHWNGLESF